jgi:hypothetical protein
MLRGMRFAAASLLLMCTVALASGCQSGIVVTLMVADVMGYFGRGDEPLVPLGSAPVSEPTRAISEQDCTRPIDPAQGNLRCR